MKELEDIKYYNAFNQIPQIGTARFHKLLQGFPDLQTAWQAPLSQLIAAGIERPVAEALLVKRPQINPDAEMEKLEACNVQLVIETDANYPPLLKQIHNPPALLYVRGDHKILASEFCLAVVGTRKISPYGKQVVPRLVNDLASSGITIVSGLALGVDELAHRCALEAKGKTVAVLGCGIDEKSIYPSSNRVIAQKIANGGGAIISELPLFSSPLKIHFPHRNRIISGMSLGTLVVEADLESGSLITARCALEQNRQVFAVPGSVFNQVSTGPNNLLKLGAKPVTEASDITEELNLNLVSQQLSAREIIPATPTEAKILALLSNEPQHINLLIKTSGLSASDISATLTMMEIKGKVRNLGAMQYVRAR